MTSTLWNNKNSTTQLSFRVIVYSLTLLAAFSILALIRLWLEIPSRPNQLEDILVFCGSLTNVMAMIAIAAQPYYFPDEEVIAANPTLDYKKVELWLTFQMIGLSVALALALYKVSSAIFPTPYPIPILTGLGSFIAIFAIGNLIKSNATRRETFAVMVSLVFFLLALGMVPVLSLVRDEFVPVDHRWWQFFEPRILPYIHLFFIPLLYLVVDGKLRATLTVANKSLRLDWALFWTGIVCVLCGLVASDLMVAIGSALFESGAAAVILLLGNWVWLLTTISD